MRNSTCSSSISNGCSRLALSLAWSIVRLTGIEKALDGGIERIEGDQDADILQGDLLARSLKGIEDRPFATGQVQACGSRFANRLKDFLHELKLIRSKRIVLNEILSVLVRPERHATIGERQLVLENIAFVR